MRKAWLETEFRRGVLAFGGAILISAVSLELVPEGSRHLGILPAVAALAFGGVAFMVLDRRLAVRAPCRLGGHFLLAGHPGATGGLMLAAAGGILYITFQDIAPQARLLHHWGPPLGAVHGFLVGLAAHMWLQTAPRVPLDVKATRLLARPGTVV